MGMMLVNVDKQVRFDNIDSKTNKQLRERLEFLEDSGRVLSHDEECERELIVEELEFRRKGYLSSPSVVEEEFERGVVTTR